MIQMTVGIRELKTRPGCYMQQVKAGATLVATGGGNLSGAR
jgi:antitoxin (DNA-binding transcriptional repressor) of toxin-antitoxin stability system